MSTEVEEASASGPSIHAGGDIVQKLEQAKELKDKGDAAFQQGETKAGAMHAYFCNVI